MEALVGLFLMLLGVSHGMETYCDGRQNGTQCYGALGGTVVLRLMDSAPEIFRYTRNQNVILNWSDNKFKSNLISNRSFFTPSNGTLRINNLSRNDGGEYTLDIFDSGGKLLDQRTLQLSIQAPVSSVLLVSECLSQGEMKVSCSSEGGDSPQYSWTLDGRTLTDAELLSGNHETNNITLKQDVSGRLVCSVRNNVSRVSEVQSISSCGFIFINCTLSNGTHISQWVLAASNTLCIEPTTAPTTITNPTKSKETGITVSVKPSTNISTSSQTVTSSGRADPWFIKNLPLMAGVLSALVFLVLLGGAVIYTQEKMKRNKATEEADEQELTYAEVRIVQRQGLKVQQRAEVEVEYGQVKYSEQPRQTVVPTGDDCVYAKVHKSS